MSDCQERREKHNKKMITRILKGYKNVSCIWNMIRLLSFHLKSLAITSIIVEISDNIHTLLITKKLWIYILINNGYMHLIKRPTNLYSLIVALSWRKGRFSATYLKITWVLGDLTSCPDKTLEMTLKARSVSS